MYIYIYSAYFLISCALLTYLHANVLLKFSENTWSFVPAKLIHADL